MSEVLEYLPGEASVDQVRAVLAKETPKLAVSRVELIKNGWDNQVALVNGEWIFRFPRDAEFPSKLELDLLQGLQGRLSVRSPKPEFVGKETAFMAYRVLPGRFLEEAEVPKLKREAKQALAQDLARFAFEFHQLMPAQEALRAGWPAEMLEREAEFSLVYLRESEPELYDYACRAQDKIRRLVFDQAPAFLYDDLHLENFLVDEQLRLCGVIDFGDCAVGDRSYEFRYLRRYDDAFLEATVSAYEALSGLKIDRKTCEWLGWEDALGDLASGIKEKQPGAMENALRWMRNWTQKGI